MIRCSVCGKENDDLAVICAGCKSYLQSKVDNLNLFETMWGVIESPRIAFKKIVLAQHKNYVFLLSSLLGIYLVYMLLWYKNWGHAFSNIIEILGAGLILGPVLGIPFVYLFSLLMQSAARLVGGKGSVRSMFAVVSYASLLLVFALVFVLPIEVAIFGSYFFERNPPPLVINPAVYITLLGLDFLALIWSWLLLVEGSIVSNGFSRKKSLLLVLAVMVLTGFCSIGIYLL